MGEITEQDIDNMIENEIDTARELANKTPLERAITVLEVHRGILDAMVKAIDRFIEEERKHGGKI